MAGGRRFASCTTVAQIDQKFIRTHNYGSVERFGQKFWSEVEIRTAFCGPYTWQSPALANNEEDGS